MPKRPNHLVPTHVRVPETLVTLAGVSLSVRQFLLILVGVALSFRVWQLCGILAWLPAGSVVRDIATAIPLGVAMAFAFVTLASRPLDVWCVVALRYRLRPRCFVWRSVRFVDPGFSGSEPEEETRA